jgi:D-alanyl-D-alanine carboxypeptidase/D-alanyl-D-alanine-endopeptidase (penicillin-binding protein 4)
VAIVLGGLGSLSHTSNHDAQVIAGPPVPVSPPKAPLRGKHPASHGPARDVVLPDHAPATTHAVLSLRRALAATMRHAGASSGALVVDIGSGSELFSMRDAVKRAPASVEKLYTTVALMRVMGPDTRLTTAVLGKGKLLGGTWRGNLYLRGGGDPTFGDAGFNRIWEQGDGPTPNQLIGQLRGKGIRRVTGLVFADESLFDRRRGGLMTDYAPDIPDYGGQLSALTYDHGSALHHLGPAEFAAKEFVLTMRGSGITATAARHPAATPRRARLLARVSSPPMAVMTRLMDVPSDDLFADLLTKQLGVRFGHGGTLSAGAKVISAAIASDYRLHPLILDGSGLARRDRTSPLEVVDLLREVWHTPTGNLLAASLPVVGRQGTVQTLGLKTPAVGRCVAKTGTLNDVTNLAGYCHSLGGHTLAFALFIDGPPNWTALTLESKMVGAIARY